jgi:ectoine hydroxylase-related dioxygenase (phytanoyl-CoA dioxygenase family)
MSEADRYLFDLNGYVVVRGVLTPDQVRRANEAVDRRAGEFVERSDPELRNARRGTPLYGTGPGRRDLGRVLEWEGDESEVFRSILAHERLVPLFHGLLGEGYRLDHLPLVISQEGGAEGFRLHGGTVDCETGEYNPHLAYTCVRDTIRTQLLGCNVMLTDHNEGDGGFCVVPGSHKSNFRMPGGMVDGTDGGGGDRLRDFVRQPATRAGDVVLFSEGTVHGALPWTPQNRPRRACLYRFAPATAAYGRSYFSAGEGASSAAAATVGWPPAVYQGRLTDAQRAVLEPPYASRLDRPVIADASSGSVKTSGRSDRKKRHDRQVFGTPYF